MELKDHTGWLLTAASQPGMSHIRRGEPCADAFAISQNGSVLVLAVADGAGSARFGGQAARFVTQEAVRVAQSLCQNGSPPGEPFLREVFRLTLAGLLRQITCWRTEAVAPTAEPPDPVRPSDYHATLMLAVLSESLLCAANIGDGWIVVRGRDGIARAVAPPARGEYCNETFFLTSEHAVEDAVCETVSIAEIDAIAILTDGPSWLAIDLEARQPGQAFFEKLFRFAADPSVASERKDEELADFLASEPVCRKTDDDKTLMLAVRSESLAMSPEGTLPD